MFKDSANWIAFREVLIAKCLRQPEENNQCHDTVAALSAAKDQGGYVRCNQKLLISF